MLCHSKIKKTKKHCEHLLKTENCGIGGASAVFILGKEEEIPPLRIPEPQICQLYQCAININIDVEFTSGVSHFTKLLPPPPPINSSKKLYRSYRISTWVSENVDFAALLEQHRFYGIFMFHWSSSFHLKKKKESKRSFKDHFLQPVIVLRWKQENCSL